MKVVCCKNCGAKYQLDDDDDITTFECSSCAGDLEYLEEYSNGETKSDHTFMSSINYDNSYIVQCQDCGLKFKIKSSDSIIDYECDSCGGPLRYLDEDMNKELDKYLEERNKEVAAIRRENMAKEPTSEELKAENNIPSIKSITGKLENFFSEERLLEIADDERREEELEDGAKTARTTIPLSVLSKFGKEFAVPNTNDYNILKNFLKDEFFKGMEEYYPKNLEASESGGFFDKFGMNEPGNELKKSSGILIDNDENKGLDVKNIDSNHTIAIIGAIIFIISIAEILLINSGVGIIALFIGVIILCYGIYKTRDVKEVEERTRIIREHLLSLPEEF